MSLLALFWRQNPADAARGGSLLPNASHLELALERAVQDPVLPVPLRDLWDPQRCPEELLPWLAWGLSVDDWDASWPVAVRREVVAGAIEVHRRKGTIHAVRRAVAAFGGAIAIREWWQTDPPGTPGTFELVLAVGDIEGGAPSAAYLDSIINQVARAKPLSRHFSFIVAEAGAARIGLAATARPAAYARIACADDGPEGSVPIGILAVARPVNFIRLNGAAA